MIRNFAALLLSILFLPCFAQNSDTALISIQNFKLDPGTFSWRDGNSFYDMTNWDSGPYTQGNLKQYAGNSWQFRMNYRLLFPNSYNASYEEGYPLLIMFHGAGERGNCWEQNCYCVECNPNQPEDGKAQNQFLNNDHMLVHGGQPFLNAVNLAGSKKAEDESLNPRAFPGFVLFPQMENSWGSAGSSTSAVSYALRILRLVMKEHNVNPDRVYIAGLSMGGQAVLKSLTMADWLFAAGIAMSPVPFIQDFDYEGSVTVPLWLFQGGLDQFPKPAQTEQFINLFKTAGGTVRYTFYPDAGHNTWSRAFAEPEFFSWLMQFKRNDIYSYFETDYLCATSDEGVQLALPPGFPGYQWEKDGAVIDGQTENVLLADEPGIYRARLSRKENPAEDDWNEWSEPLELKTFAPQAPDIQQTGTTFLPDLNGNNDVILYSTTESPYYFWERNSLTTDLPDTSIVKFSGDNGTYTLRIADFNECKSNPSPIKHVFFNDQAPRINEMRPETFTAEPMSSSEVFLSWDDASGLEQGYEIWRKNTSVSGSAWEMATITNRSVTFYYDTMLMPGSVYHYKIRAISSKGRSDYFPSNSSDDNLIVTLADENDIPSPPQNIRAEMIDVTSAKIEWEPGDDESGIAGYVIMFGDQTIETNTTATSHVVKNVELNRQYAITVSTRDISGNTSPPGNQYMLSTKITGLFYKHSTGAWNSLADPAIQDTWNNPEYTGHVANITLEPRVQQEYFNFEFTGYLRIEQAGNYMFYLNSDDGSQFFLDDELIIDYDGFHGICNGTPESTSCPNGWGRPSSTINLSKGSHLLKIRFFQYTGGKNLFLRYAGPDTGGSVVLVPDESLSSGSAPGRINPAAPGAPQTASLGMRSIGLSWTASPTAGVSYEVYRSDKSSGPFAIINRVQGLSFEDTGLIPGKTYYYRLRAISSTGQSPYTATTSGTTSADTQKPTTPEELAIESGNISRVILRWQPSSDNVAVQGYEIWADNTQIGFSRIPAFEYADLIPGEIYEFHVVAVDISGNRSGQSNKVNNELLITGPEPEIPSHQRFSLFPNPGPSSGIALRLVPIGRHKITITVRDVARRMVLQRTISAPSDGIDVNLTEGRFLPDGFYVLEIVQGNEVMQAKFIIRNN